MEPTFEEFCNTSPKESQPNLRQSWMVVFAMVSWPFSAQSIAPHDRPARGAGERVVPRALHALEPAVHALEAEHVRRQLAVGIETQRLVQEPEPRLAERAHPRDDGRRELAPQPDEGLAGGELRVQLALRRVEDRRQPRGDAHGIAQRARLGEE